MTPSKTSSETPSVGSRGSVAGMKVLTLGLERLFSELSESSGIFLQKQLEVRYYSNLGLQVLQDPFSDRHLTT